MLQLLITLGTQQLQQHKIMKYIKSFNEELKSTTYRSAGWKIRELGRNKSERNKKIYNDRSNLLFSRSVEIKKIENRSEWEQLISQLKNKQPFKGVLHSDRDDRKVEGNFYIHLDIDGSGIVEMNDYDDFEGKEIGFYFYPGFIPADEETFNKCENELDNSMDDGIYRYILLGGIYVKLERGMFSNMHVNYHDHTSNFDFSDMRGYKVFKNEISNAFLKHKEDIDNVIVEMGVGSDYGIDFKDIYEFSRKMRADDLVH